MNANGDKRRGDRERPEEATRGCEFCRAEFNRPAGEFTCPYCHAVWNGKEGCPMKQKDIHIGRRYTAKLSGRI